MLLSQAAGLLREGGIAGDRGIELRLIAAEVAQLAWGSQTGLLEALTVGASWRAEPEMLRFLESTLAPTSMATRLVHRGVADSITRLFLDETSADLQRIYLWILKTHLWSPDGKPQLHLAAEAVTSIMARWASLTDERSMEHLLGLVGPYARLHSEVVPFLESKVRDRQLPSRVRAEALAGYSSAAKIDHGYVSLALELVREDPDPVLRREAADLVGSLGVGELDHATAVVVFETLKVVALQDPDPGVRGMAARTILGFEDGRSLRAAEDLIAAEKDPAVRAFVMRGFEFTRYRDGENTYSAQRIATQVFDTDSDDGVRQTAADVFLSLVNQTIVREQDGAFRVDRRTMDQVQVFVGVVRRRPPSAETKALLRKRLVEFERTFPDLGELNEYRAFKTWLESS